MRRRGDIDAAELGSYEANGTSTVKLGRAGYSAEAEAEAEAEEKRRPLEIPPSRLSCLLGAVRHATTSGRTYRLGRRGPVAHLAFPQL